MSEETQVVVQERGFMDMIGEAARDPNVSVEKLERLMALKERHDALTASQAFAEAMARLQPKLPRITKHGRVVVNGQLRHTYAKLEDIDEIIRPLYTEEGFSISWNTRQGQSGSGVTTTVLGTLRRGAHAEPYEITLPHDASGSKNGIQAVGSTVAYGKRYLVCGMFNIITVEEDDDGSGAEPITQAKVNQLRDLIMDRNADEARFCKYMDVQSVEEITKDRFEMAMNALQNKGRK